jgi:hypothetical protein
MMSRTIAFLVGAILLSGPLLASSVRAEQTHSAAIADLKKRQAAVERQRANVATKLSAADSQQLSKQRARVQELIDRMEAGQDVTSDEIDRALGLSR